VPLVLWSIVFEIVLPPLGPFRGIAIANPVDVLCYAAGALVGAAFWRWGCARERRGPAPAHTVR
jgi:hypothetical protein